MREYVFKKAFSSPGAVTLLQIKAPTAKPLLIYRAWLNSTDQTTSAQRRVQLLRKDPATAGTLTIATAAADESDLDADIVQLDPSDPATNCQLSGSGGTGTLATVEGTARAVLIDEGFNVVSGWSYLPVPEERISVPAGGVIALKTPTALPAGNYQAGIVFAEMG